MDSSDAVPSPTNLRILSLLPATTEIIGSLGLGEYLVGVTHECDVLGDLDGENDLSLLIASGSCKRVTTTSLGSQVSMTQAQIDHAVAEAYTSNTPMFAINAALVKEARPTIVLTQDLCGVCAAGPEDVRRALEDGGGCARGMRVESYAPGTLMEVAESIEHVGEACGVPRRGARARREFEDRLVAVREATHAAKKQRTVLLLEWLDPAYDGGHWVPGMIVAAGCVPVLNAVEGAKSKARSWAEVAAADPDVVLFASCGFDLRRNLTDAAKALRTMPELAGLRAVRTGRAYCVDGNRYFARPGPSLAAGTALVARCAFDDEPEVVRRLEALPFLPNAWARLCDEEQQDVVAVAKVGDIDTEDFDLLHETACAEGRMTYTDPATGYGVMTRLAHQKRGKCCGSGCRHCPYQHANVRDKAQKIQNPAFLHLPDAGLHREGVTALMWSGGKDSFLALRALLRKCGGDTTRMVLITTFDVKTRVIANQEVHVSQVERQAKHLDVAVVGVPLHPCSAGYVKHISSALEVVAGQAPVLHLACGDLHLRHIREWRETQLGIAGLGLSLAFPIWSDDAGCNYDALTADLEASGVPCIVSAVTEPAVGVAEVGELYTRALAGKLEAAGLDAFGENGEIHSLAEVWRAPRERALGLLL